MDVIHERDNIPTYAKIPAVSLVIQWITFANLLYVHGTPVKTLQQTSGFPELLEPIKIMFKTHQKRSYIPCPKLTCLANEN